MLKKLNSTHLAAFVPTDISLLILRVSAALFMFVGHGKGKIMQVMAGEFQFADPLGIGAAPSLVIAAFTEGICTLLIMAGFYTRLAALLLTLNMAVAFVFVHIADPFAKMELALLYLLANLVIFLLGPGNYSVDGSMRPDPKR